MNELQIFTNEQFGAVRTITIAGEPWFVAADVCRALEIANHKDAISRLDDDEKSGVVLTDPHGREQITNCISEPGLYTLVLGSRKKEAKAFKRWITHDVIPAIRKHGGYIAGEEHMDDDQLLAQAVLVAQRKLEERTAQLDAANRQIEADRPKVIFADAVSAANTSISVGDLSKILHQNGVKKLNLKSGEKTMGQNNLFEWLRDNGYLIKQGSSKNMPTQTSTERGLVEIKESIKADPNGTLWVTKTPKITGKGQQYFINLFVKAKEETT